MIKYLMFLGSASVQLSRTGKKWISVDVRIRPVFPDLVTISLIVILLSHVRRDLSLRNTYVVMNIHLKIVFKWALNFSTLAITYFNSSSY